MEFLENTEVGFWKIFDSMLKTKEKPTKQDDLYYAIANLQLGLLQCYRKILAYNIGKPLNVPHFEYSIPDLRDECSAILAHVVRCNRAKGPHFLLSYDVKRPWHVIPCDELLRLNMSLSIMIMTFRRVLANDVNILALLDCTYQITTNQLVEDRFQEILSDTLKFLLSWASPLTLRELALHLYFKYDPEKYEFEETMQRGMFDAPPIADTFENRLNLGLIKQPVSVTESSK
jgi:hypothetical protein